MLINLGLTGNHSYNIYQNSTQTNNYFPRNLSKISAQDNFIHSQKAKYLSFGAKVPSECLPAELPKDLQLKVASIRKSIKNIKDFFAQYAISNPALNARIKKGYQDLVIKKKSAIIFKHMEGSTVTVMQGQRNPNLLYLSIDKEDSEIFNGIIADGYKLIKNYRPNNPHMMPSSIQYMDKENIANSNAEEFIDLAFEKISKYNHYISKFQTGETPLPKADIIHPTLIKGANQELAVIHKNSIIAKAKRVQKQPPKDTGKTNKIFQNASKEFSSESNIKQYGTKINDIFSINPKELPPHIKPKVAPSGKIVGFSVETSDGGILKVSKVANTDYGNSMLYLSIVKINPDQTRNYISIDLANYSVLKTRTEGKPYITADHVVHELTSEEISKRKIEEKLDNYTKEIIRDFKTEEIKVEDTPKKITPTKQTDNQNIEKKVEQKTETKKRKRKPSLIKKETNKIKPDNESKPVSEKISLAESPNTNTQEIPETSRENLLADFKTRVANLAKQDALELANEYRKVFLEEFTLAIKNIKTEINKKAEEVLSAFINKQ